LAENYLTGATTTVSALVDPMIGFDPSFNSTGFSLELSPGVGNEFIPSSVPESSTLFLTGAALLGAIAVRSRRQHRPLARPNESIGIRQSS